VHYPSILLIIFFFLSNASATEQLCPTIMLDGPDIELSATEKRLVCGDQQLEAYKEIPSYEASYILTGFLQSRGYLKPTFELVNNVLNVKIGKKSFVKKIRVISENTKLKKIVKSELRRLYRRKILTTSVLNSIEAEALSLVRQNGYPCSKVKSTVDVSESLVLVDLGSSHYFEFGPVAKTPIQGLEENALDRYYPFKANEAFNEDLLTLTEKRMLRADVVQGTYFLENCSVDNTKFSLSQNFIIGPPRTIRFGAGASTEVGPMARVRWSNNRYKPMASQLSANLQASFRAQSITLAADSFFWQKEPRRSLLAQAELIRESQIDYEQVVFRLKPHMKWTRDSERHFKKYTLGPSYEAGTYLSKSISDTESYSTGILEGSVQWMSHPYELFDVHPEEGDSFNFSFDYRHPDLGFSDQLLKLETSFVRLERLTNWGRGTLIGGARINAGTTWVADDVSLADLPPTVKFFGGGSDDVRGFQLRTLPDNDGLGSLTKLALKLELRRTNVYKETVEVFSFLDSAYFGAQSWELDPVLYYSPGLGVRWLSPIGLVQSYLARAFKSHPYEDLGNLFFLGLGGVF
jgi:translocation and assembly module TamA